MPLMLARCVAVGGSDAGRFLAAMLQSVEAEIGLARGVGMAVDRDDAAFFVKLVAGGDCLAGGITDRGTAARLELGGRSMAGFRCFDPWKTMVMRMRRRLPAAEKPVSCENLFVEIGFQGGGPDPAQVFKGCRDEGLAIDVDLKTSFRR